MKFSALRKLLCLTFGSALLLGSFFEGCATPQEKEEAAEKASAAKAVNSGNVVVTDKGGEFLAENKTKEGVRTTASGLQYKVLREGTGRQPTASDVVVCNYRGTLVNGKEFDSSYKRGQPAEFSLHGVIAGWTEGVQLMKEGAKYQFFIPSRLGYGINGSGDLIGPNETLIFEVELIRVK